MLFSLPHARRSTRMIDLAFAKRLCALAAAAVLLATAAIAEPEPSWEVFDDREDRTTPPVADAMLKLANVTATDFVYDLGCGDGVIVVMAAKRYGAKAFGIDINPKMVARAKANAEKSGVADKTTFVEGDLYKADLKPATVITLFLWRSMNIRLRPRLLDLTAGVRIVSHEHDMGKWTPDRTIYVYNKEWGRLPLYLWIVPAQIAGNWQLSVDGAELSAEIKQTYQRFHGSAFAIGRKHRIRNGRLDGAKVTFELAMASGERKHYSGIATSDGVIEGRGWRARRKR
jgi:SAM-dependent methyltransferase